MILHLLCKFKLDQSCGVCRAHWTQKLRTLSDLQKILQIAREDGTVTAGLLLLIFSQVPFGMRPKIQSEVGDMQGPLGGFWLCLVV